jgi:hypothetical protein
MDSSWWWVWLPWILSQLAYPVVLAIAARRNRVNLPQAARWTMLVAGLQLVSFGLNATMQWLAEPLSFHGSSGYVLRDPGTWATLMRLWIQGLLPAAGLLILAYVILEQPDRPRAPRPDAAS